MNKIYKVTVKVEYEVTMYHTQKTKKKAISDIKSVVDEVLKMKDKHALETLFDSDIPKTRYSAVIKSEKDK